MKAFLLALVAVFVVSTAADAKSRHRHHHPHRHHQTHKTPHHPHVTRVTPAATSAECFIFCDFQRTGSKASKKAVQRADRRAYRRSARASKTLVRASVASNSHHIGGIVGPLAAKVSQITAACGSTVISGVRHTRVAGSGRMSLHASGKAVDMRGNPSCIYAQLQGWSGGYTTDYGRMKHIHISYDASGGREMGLRFAHGGGHRHSRTRYARRHHHHHRVRYARAA